MNFLQFFINNLKYGQNVHRHNYLGQGLNYEDAKKTKRTNILERGEHNL